MNKKVTAVLLAAGSSMRMGEDENGERINKLLLDIGGKTPVRRCAEAFLPFADEFVFAVSEATAGHVLRVAETLGKPFKTVMGGKRRQDSVLNALNAASGDIVAVHDCARCFVSSDVIRDAIACAGAYGSGVAALKVRDTLRRESDGTTVDRDGLYSMQTPQCFLREKLLEAYRGFDDDITDDASVWRIKYGNVHFSKGDIMNQKLTERSDIELFSRLAQSESGAHAAALQRMGFGEDTHRFAEGRRLVIGGVEIPYEKGLLGHSDADVLVHAVIDAILGACAMGDIGRHFPDSDEAYRGISSLELLRRTHELVSEAGFRIVNIDATVIAQKPKLAPYIEEMRKKTAEAMAGVGVESISIKATTPEGLGPEGRLEGITARAVASVCAVGGA